MRRILRASHARPLTTVQPILQGDFEIAYATRECLFVRAVVYKWL